MTYPDSNAALDDAGVPSGTAPTSDVEARAKEAAQLAAAEGAREACIASGAGAPAAAACGVVGGEVAGRLWNLGHEGAVAAWESVFGGGNKKRPPSPPVPQCAPKDCATPPPEALLDVLSRAGVPQKDILRVLGNADAGIEAKIENEQYLDLEMARRAPGWRESQADAARAASRAFWLDVYDRPVTGLLARTRRALYKSQVLLALLSKHAAEETYLKETGVRGELQPDGSWKTASDADRFGGLALDGDASSSGSGGFPWKTLFAVAALGAAGAGAYKYRAKIKRAFQ